MKDWDRTKKLDRMEELWLENQNLEEYSKIFLTYEFLLAFNNKNIFRPFQNLKKKLFHARRMLNKVIYSV